VTPITKPTEFNARLDAALAQRELDNAGFAALLGKHGQQVVHNWRVRGRIGRDSYDAVRAALPGISMDWLNDGEGEGEPGYTLASHLDPEAVADAYTSLSARFERAGLVYSPALDPDLFAAAIEYADHPSREAKASLHDAVAERISQRMDAARRRGGAIVSGSRSVR
jgi:hypothetical protein